MLVSLVPTVSVLSLLTGFSFVLRLTCLAWLGLVPKESLNVLVYLELNSVGFKTIS